MFDFIDKHKRLAQLVLGVIALTFVFFGTYSYFQKGSGVPEVASVDGDKITQADFDELMKQQQDRMRQTLGANYDPAMFDSPEVRYAMVEQLVNQKLLEREARAGRLRITDGQLQQFIAALPPFQDDGKFSPDRYKMVLAAQGLSAPMFEQKLRNDLTVAPLQEPIGSANIVASSSAKRYLSLLEQKREISMAIIAPESFASEVKLDDAALHEFYDKNKTLLETPEQAKFEYIILSPEAMAAKVTVTPDEVRKRYDQNIAQYGAPEERSAAHILITLKPDATAADKEVARKKAEDLATQARAKPADFAALAKANSQDPGSAAQGGDLGSFTHDSMVKPFADAVFAAKSGDIVGPVLSEFGYHVIKVGAITPSKARPFDDVKADIEAAIRRERAQSAFADAADKFQDLVYTQADSLAGIAKTLGLELATTPSFVTRPQAQALARGNAKFATALFAPESTQGKRNTEAVEIAPNTLMAARIVEYKPASVRPFDEMKDDIRKQLVRKESLALAQKAGSDKVVALASGKSDKDVALSFGRSIEVLRTQAGAGITPDALVKVFSVDASKLPAYVGAPNERGGYSVYRVSRVIEPATLDDARVKIAGERIGDQIGRELLAAYLANLKAKSDVKINQAALERKPQS